MIELNNPRPRLLVTRRLPAPVEERLSRSYDTTLNKSDRALSQSDLAAALGQFDAICTTITDTIGGDLLGDAKPTLKILANYGAGYEHIDTRAAAARGIMVSNTPDVLTDATAELAIMLMLMAARRAGEGERELRANQWTGWRPTHLIGQGLTGKTLGLVGFGRIARATAKKARSAFDMEIAYFTRNRADTTMEQQLGATFYSSLEELAGVSDILSLHIPAGPGTRHLVDARLLSRLRPSAILVNTARGSLIDEAALAEALRSGHIAGAGLDVFENEPAVSKDLLEAPGAVLLPHLGSATSETRVAMGMRVAENLDACFAGEEPRDRVI